MKVLNGLSRRCLLQALALIASSYPFKLFASSGSYLGELVNERNLGQQTTAVLFDLGSNKILESHNKDLRLPLASVTKAVTAVYAMEVVGAQHTFATKLFTDGSVQNGRLDGNLYLIGGADPSLSTSHLYNFVEALKNKGILDISGSFFYYSEVIPEFLTIDPSQLPEASFNPGFSGLNLNSNKVIFSWLKKGKDYKLTLKARSLNSQAVINNITIVEKKQTSSLFNYSLEKKLRIEKWVVSKNILGKKGARWLPVRFASTHASSVLYYLFSKSGITVRPPERLTKKVSGLQLLYRHKSIDLSLILKEMLDKSTNVTAEIIGVFAANFWGLKTPEIVSSGKIMSKWFNFVSKTDDSIFFNHSGLTTQSRVSGADFTKFLSRTETSEVLVQLLKEQRVYGTHEKEIREANVKVLAKTGTMHFNRGLAGYIMKDEIPRAVFAIFSADLQKKQTSENGLELSNPPGHKSWLLNAKHLENSVVAHWAKLYL